MAWFAIYVLVSFQNPLGFSKSGRDPDLQYTHLVPKCCFALCHEFTLYKFIFSTQRKKLLTDAFLDRQFHESVSLVASFSVLKIGGPFYVKTPCISNHFSKYTYLTLSSAQLNCAFRSVLTIAWSSTWFLYWVPLHQVQEDRRAAWTTNFFASLSETTSSLEQCALYLASSVLPREAFQKKVVIFHDICH